MKEKLHTGKGKFVNVRSGTVEGNVSGKIKRRRFRPRTDDACGSWDTKGRESLKKIPERPGGGETGRKGA